MRLIDADALKEVFKEKSTEAVLGAGLCKAIIAQIDSKPTVEAEPVRHGKWIYGENLDGFDGYRCSHCMTHFAVDDVSDYHCCPYCGAKMDERKKE